MARTTTVDAPGSARQAGAAGPALLSLEGIVKHWPGAPVLSGVDLRVEPGAAVAVSGRNGSGKTTLLRIASGLIAADAGTVRLAGLDAARDRTEFQRRVGFLSAGNSGLYGRLRAEHHLELWSRLALLPRGERARAIDRAVADFALEPLLGKRVDRLSMGQRQRLRLALAFLHGPDALLLDEPATSLDEDGLALLGAAIESLKARGGAALVCLPTGWDALPVVDREYVLAGGGLEGA
ncbi:MAG TPA: ABC transporter ATP-binding protein [Thermoleophilaceae bacterium]|jgi:ABC-2 type transport system ATP-binding protein